MTVTVEYGEVTLCATTVNRAFLDVELAYKGGMVLVACVLSFLVRKISGIVAGSRVMMLIIYNIAVVSVVVLLIINNVSSAELAILSQVIGISVCVTLASVLLVAPVTYRLITIGDDAAADAVMHEIFVLKRRNSAEALPAVSTNEHKNSSESVRGVSSWMHHKNRTLPHMISRPSQATCTQDDFQRLPSAPLSRYDIDGTQVLKSTTNVEIINNIQTNPTNPRIVPLQTTVSSLLLFLLIFEM